MGLEGILAAILGVIGAVWLAYTRGKGAGRQSEKDRAARDYQRTMEGAANADVARDAGAGRDWLRNRPADKR